MSTDEIIGFMKRFLAATVYSAMDNEIEKSQIQVDSFTYQDGERTNYIEKVFDGLCNESNDINCTDGITTLLFSTFLKTKLYHKGTFVKDFKILFSMMLKLKTQETLSYFDYSFSNADNEYSSLDEDFLKEVKIFPLNFKKEYESASKLFHSAQSELIAILKEIDLKEVNTIALKVKSDQKVVEDLRTINKSIIDIVSQINQVQQTNIDNQTLGIKNFDYDAKKEQLFVKLAFYFNFPLEESVVKNEVSKRYIKQLILHEFGHLYGFNDENSGVFAKSLLHYLENSVQVPTKKQFIEINEHQLSGSELFKKWSEYETEMINKHFGYFADVLRGRGITAVPESFKLNVKESNEFCNLNNTSINCNLPFEVIRIYKTYEVHLNDENNKKYKYLLNLSMQLSLEANHGNHGFTTGKILMSSENELLDFYVKVFDENEQLLFQINSESVGDEYDKAFRMKGISEKIVLESF